MNNKTVLAVSGGVDSAVCGKLLLDEGKDVSGLYLIMSDAHIDGTCDAEKVCDELGIKLTVRDVRDKFREKVSIPFCEFYCSGKTPNPCVVCNPYVKFSSISEYAEEIEADYIATGHYARIYEKDGFYFIQKALSSARDQSYMLYRLGQNILSKLLLPLGSLEKSTVRAIAEQSIKSVADKPDSQEICFIPDGNIAGYIERNGFVGKKGCFFSPEGKNIGQHLGIEHYTVGQRKGLGVAMGQPVYVKRILDNGDIELGYDNIGQTEYRIESSVIFPHTNFITGNQYEIKLRSMAKPVSCTVTDINKDIITVLLSSPCPASSPGQSAVLYDGEIIVAGGFISRC